MFMLLVTSNQSMKRFFISSVSPIRREPTRALLLLGETLLLLALPTEGRGRFRFAERAVRAMGSRAPIEDAQVLTTLVLRMEYHAIVDGVEDFDLEAQRAVLQRFLDLVVGA